MRNRIAHILTALMLVCLFGEAALAQTQFRIPIYLASAAFRDTMYIGVSGDGPGGVITDNTFGVDDNAVFGPYGQYREAAAPPDPPTVNLYARHVVGGVLPAGRPDIRPWDYRGFTSSSQADTFQIRIYGDEVLNSGVTISWPSNLNLYGSSWTLVSYSGGPVASTNMLTTTSVTSPGEVRIRIIKVGAFAPTPGPTFVLSAPSLNFGNVTVGGNATQNVVVTNTGTTNALTINGASTAAPYTIVPVPPTAFPINVAAGASQTFAVTFAPTASGTAAGSVSFTHTAPGSPTALGLTGVGVSQGGTLEFAAGSRTRLDNTTNYQDTIGLVNYVGANLKSLQFRVVFPSNADGKTLMIARSISRGAAIPAPQFSFSTQIFRGAALSDGSRNDTFAVVILGNGSNSLAPGSYSDLVRFNYDVVNIGNPDAQTTSISLRNVLGATAETITQNAGVVAGPDQGITVNNRTLRGDINDDDFVDVLDVLLAIDHTLGRITLSTAEITRGDVAPWPAGDGVVDALDIAQLETIILNNAYPDGSRITTPVINPGPKTKGGDVLARITPGMDAKVTFHLTELGIAVRLENKVPVKGVQIELDQFASVPENMQVASVFANASHKLADGTLRVLLFDQAANTIVEPGERIIANIPVPVTDPAGISVVNVVLGAGNNSRITKYETELTTNAAPELPVDYALEQNYPNPFNPSTTVRFSVPVTSDVTVKIYNMLGQEIRTLFAGTMDRGTKSIEWDGRDNVGRQMSTGTYLYRMVAGSFTESKKMVLVK
jgi:hypothetical protein